jgi:hypothetical protein
VLADYHLQVQICPRHPAELNLVVLEKIQRH